MSTGELSDAQLAQQRQMLEALKVELQELLSSDDSGGAVELDQSRVGRLSRMDAMQQQAMAVAKLDTYKRRLRSVVAALQRIEEDDYGFCKVCDEPIPLARLQIRPEAEYCLNCQDRADRQ